MAITLPANGTITGNPIRMDAGSGSPGSIIQVVSSQITGSSNIGTNSATPVASGLITTITPKRAGSSFYTICVGNSMHNNQGANNHGLRVHLYCKVASGSYTNVASDFIQSSHRSGGSWTDFPGSMAFNCTPTYSLGDAVYFQPYYARGGSTSNTMYWHHTGGSGSGAIIQQTVMEIGG